MSSDGAIFTHRALRFLERLRLHDRVSATWLAEAEEISKPTARRVINRLRDEYGAPIRWSTRRQSFVLDDQGWRFPPAALATGDEKAALFIAAGLARAVADPELRGCLERAQRRLGETLGLDDATTRRMAAAYTVERTDQVPPGLPVLLPVLRAIAARRRLRFCYSSPWSPAPPRQREVTPLHVRQLDGALYLLALEDGAPTTFHLAFTTDVEAGEETAPPPTAEVRRWRQSFGVWCGPGALEVVIQIAAPAARYYALQIWHPDQVDTVDDDGTLTRRIQAHGAPELRRRLLSLGASLTWVEPASIRDAVRREALALAHRLDRPAPP